MVKMFFSVKRDPYEEIPTEKKNEFEKKKISDFSTPEGGEGSPLGTHNSGRGMKMENRFWDAKDITISFLSLPHMTLLRQNKACMVPGYAFYSLHAL